MMYQRPGIQILGTISAFINQRLVEIVKPTDYADWRVTRFQRFVDNQDALPPPLEVGAECYAGFSSFLYSRMSPG